MLFPPRPRGRSRKRKIKADTKKVELDTLQSCLKGLSQDSGIGSSQEIQSLNFEAIVVPDHLKAVEESEVSPAKRKRGMVDERDSSVESLDNNGVGLVEGDKLNDTSKDKRKRVNSENDAKTCQEKINVALIEESNKHQIGQHSKNDVDIKITPKINDVTKVNEVPSKCNGVGLKRKRDSEEDIIHSSQSDLGIPELKRSRNLANGSKASLASSASSSSFESSSSEGSLKGIPDKKIERSELNMCILCLQNEKNSVFLHSGVGHMCCCYKCAIRTWNINKKCPMCNCKIKNVVKVVT